MKIKRKSRKDKPIIPEIPIAPVTEPVTPMFSENDMPPASNEAEKPKRKYTRRATGEAGQVENFAGDLLVMAGTAAVKLASLFTREEAPLSSEETNMLRTVGNACGKYVVNEQELDELAPKYAKVAVFGMVALVVGVRVAQPMIDKFTRKGIPANVSPRVVSETETGEYQG